MIYDDMDDDLELGLVEGSDALVDDIDEEVSAADQQLLQDIDFAALGIDPNAPTEAKPGSEQKVLMLAARYAAGLPLWHNEDRYDHAPATNKVSLGGPKFDA